MSDLLTPEKQVESLQSYKDARPIGFFHLLDEDIPDAFTFEEIDAIVKAENREKQDYLLLDLFFKLRTFGNTIQSFYILTFISNPFDKLIDVFFKNESFQLINVQTKITDEDFQKNLILSSFSLMPTFPSINMSIKEYSQEDLKKFKSEVLKICNFFDDLYPLYKKQPSQSLVGNVSPISLPNDLFSFLKNLKEKTYENIPKFFSDPSIDYYNLITFENMFVVTNFFLNHFDSILKLKDDDDFLFIINSLLHYIHEFSLQEQRDFLQKILDAFYPNFPDPNIQVESSEYKKVFKIFKNFEKQMINWNSPEEKFKYSFRVSSVCCNRAVDSWLYDKDQFPLTLEHLNSLLLTDDFSDDFYFLVINNVLQNFFEEWYFDAIANFYKKMKDSKQQCYTPTFFFKLFLSLFLTFEQGFVDPDGNPLFTLSFEKKFQLLLAVNNEDVEESSKLVDLVHQCYRYSKENFSKAVSPFFESYFKNKPDSDLRFFFELDLNVSDYYSEFNYIMLSLQNTCSERFKNHIQKAVQDQNKEQLA